MAKLETRDETFFQRLTRLFRSGPAIRRKIKGYDYQNFYDKSILQNNLGSYGGGAFRKDTSPFSMMGAYGILDRMARYAEFSAMEYQPEIATALDLYADESCSGDENGRCFHVFSDNPEVQKALEELFYETCNVDYDMRRWVRNLIKHGDFFLYTEVQPQIGVINVEPIPVNKIERDEGYDEEDPYAVRFKLTENGGKFLENWQVCHLRILANDAFLPYGTSFLESIRRVYNQLILIEDAMLVYRLVRSPERRVFYIDVAGIHPNEVPNYMEQVKEQMRATSIVDKMNGRQDLRYNPVSVDEDYFLPTRANSQTKIESLAGGQHVSATEDVEYIRGKMIAGLKVPKPYLGFDDNLASKASLAQIDIRFSRTITNIQKIIIAEMNKLAIIHLYARGFEGEDLLDFELRLSNPSTMAIQQKLSLWSQKFEIAGKAQETELVDEEWIQKEILGLRMEEILKIREGKEKDALRTKAIEALEPTSGPESSGIVDPFDPSNYNLPGGPVIALQQGSTPDAGLNNGMVNGKPIGVTTAEEEPMYKGGNSGAPIKVNQTPNLDKASRRLGRKRTHGSAALGMPRFDKMLGPDNKSLNDPNDSEFFRSPFKENLRRLERQIVNHTLIPERLDPYVRSILKKFTSAHKKNVIDAEIISEESENSIFSFIDIEDEQ